MDTYYKVTRYDKVMRTAYSEILEFIPSKLLYWIYTNSVYQHLKINVIETWTCKKCRAMNSRKVSNSQFKQCKHCGDISAATRN